MSESLSPPWRARWTDRWGHFGPELLMASIIGVIVLGVSPLPAALSSIAPLALLLGIFGSWLLMRRHDGQLCERCVAAMPLNPAETATRYQRRLWLAHTGSNRRFLLPYLVVLLGANLVPGPLGTIVWVLAECSILYLVLSHTTHRRLQPWCAWCRGGGGGGGGHFDPVTPDPVPGDHRQLI